MGNCTICVAKTKAMITFTVTAKLICVFVFAYADCWFSHGAAHLLCVTYLNESSISGELGSFFFLLRACLCLSSFRCLPYSMMFSQVVRHRLQVWVQPLKQPAVQLKYDINKHEFFYISNTDLHFLSFVLIIDTYPNFLNAWLFRFNALSITYRIQKAHV